MFASYVKGGWDRSASAAGDSYVPHALEGRSISVMRSENEKQRHQWAISFIAHEGKVCFERRCLAMGIAMSGTTAGGMLMTLVANYVIEHGAAPARGFRVILKDTGST
jgi:hypothetical protein